MNPIVTEACRNLLSRLGAQIDSHLPTLNEKTGQAESQVPLERLPTLAECVRVYVETEAILAGAQPPSEEQKTD